MKAFTALLLATTCQLSPSNADEFVVSYNLTAASGVSCDSVKYENAMGIVKVTGPALPWQYAYQAPPGSHVQVVAWMTATGSGQQAKLKAAWTLAGVSSAADSTFGTTTGAGKFTLALGRRPI